VGAGGDDEIVKVSCEMHCVVHLGCCGYICKREFKC